VPVEKNWLHAFLHTRGNETSRRRRRCCRRRTRRTRCEKRATPNPFDASEYHPFRLIAFTGGVFVNARENERDAMPISDIPKTRTDEEESTKKARPVSQTRIVSDRTVK